jgi:hypothetical protein
MTKLPHISLPTIDLAKVAGPVLNKLPLDKLPKVEIPKITLPQLHSVDLTSIDLSRLNPNAVMSLPAVKQVPEVGYTAVGFAVLGFQKAQVRRRELIESIKARTNTAQ